MKLKVLILDDEFIIREGLCAFPWESYGCEVVGSAEDGEEGLRLAKTLHPDILLSDIKMPEMDGLEVSEKVKGAFPETEIVLLTGYDDFEFAQQALRIGVAEYLLKPIDFKELEAVVEKICGRIRKHQKQKTDYELLKEQYRKARPQIVSKAISDALFGIYEEKEELLENLKNLRIRLDCSYVAYARIVRDVERPEENLDQGLLKFIICNVCEEIFRTDREELRVFSVTDTMGYCFVISYPEYFAEEDCMAHCEAACETARKKIREILQKNLSFGISNRSQNACELNLAYREAMEACEESSFVDDTGNVTKYGDINCVQRSICSMTDGEKKRILSELARGNGETALRLANRIFEKCEDIDILRYDSMELLTQCMRYLSVDKRELSGEQRVENDTVFLEAMEQIMSSRNRKTLLQAFRKALLYGGNQQLDLHVSRNQKIGEEIEAYIRENYANDLSLDSLAEQFRISKTYVNRLLKNHTGKSFLETLTDIRMAKAKSLIQEGEYKVYEIAEMVGYRDFSYFIRVFKKKYGTTPNNYKKI